MLSLRADEPLHHVERVAVVVDAEDAPRLFAAHLQEAVGVEAADDDLFLHAAVLRHDCDLLAAESQGVFKKKTHDLNTKYRTEHQK